MTHTNRRQSQRERDTFIIHTYRLWQYVNVNGSIKQYQISASQTDRDRDRNRDSDTERLIHYTHTDCGNTST